MWRDVPTWAKTERTGRRGSRRFIGITKRRIDTARRTRGSDQTNHGPLSSRHLMSLHPSISPILHCLFSSVLHVWTILSIWWLSISSECYRFPRCRSSGFSLSSSLKPLMTSFKKNKKTRFSWTFPTLPLLLLWGGEKNCRKSVFKKTPWKSKSKFLGWRANDSNDRVKEQRYSSQPNSLSQFESTVGGPKHENESVG